MINDDTMVGGLGELGLEVPVGLALEVDVEAVGECLFELAAEVVGGRGVEHVVDGVDQEEDMIADLLSKDAGHGVETVHSEIVDEPR